MKRVYICAPFQGDEAECSQTAKCCTEYALRCGAAPVVPYFFGLEQNRRYGDLCASAAHSLLWLCDEIWIIGDETTEQMRQDIRFCKHLSIPVRRISKHEFTNLIGGNVK